MDRKARAVVLTKLERFEERLGAVGLFGGVLAVGFVFGYLIASKKEDAALLWAVEQVEECEVQGSSSVAECFGGRIEAAAQNRAELIP